MPDVPVDRHICVRYDRGEDRLEVSSWFEKDDSDRTVICVSDPNMFDLLDAALNEMASRRE